MAHRPVLDDVDFSSISVEDASWLDRPFEEEEVIGVINDFMCGAGILLSKRPFRSFFVLVGRRIPRWLKS